MWIHMKIKYTQRTMMDPKSISLYVFSNILWGLSTSGSLGLHDV
jgi:hypothetical protein